MLFLPTNIVQLLMGHSVGEKAELLSVKITNWYVNKMSVVLGFRGEIIDSDVLGPLPVQMVLKMKVKTFLHFLKAHMES